MATAPIDIQILDDGTGLCTVTFLDAKKNPIPQPAGSSLAFTSSDTINAPVTANTDGVSATVTPSGALVTGVTITATLTLIDGTTTYSASEAVDVVADPSQPGGIALAIAPK